MTIKIKPIKLEKIQIPKIKIPRGPTVRWDIDYKRLFKKGERK